MNDSSRYANTDEYITVSLNENGIFGCRSSIYLDRTIFTNSGKNIINKYLNEGVKLNSQEFLFIDKKLNCFCFYLKLSNILITELITFNLSTSELINI